MGTQLNNLIEIVGGQSKFELLSQLHDIGRFRGLGSRPNFLVKILHPHHGGLGQEFNIELSISGIVAEDGSGNCWIINGYIAGGYSWLRPGTDNSFVGFYDTRTRKGHLKPRLSVS